MANIVGKVKRKVKEWVGSSVIHLGDDMVCIFVLPCLQKVPNAFMFIDKYTQIPRLLGPIVITMEQIQEICKDEGLRKYVESVFGGKESLKKGRRIGYLY